MRSALNFATAIKIRKISLTWYVPIGTVAAKPIFIMFNKRIGPDPHANGAKTAGCSGCPDIWELENGDFAVIGIDMTDVADRLPPTAGCGPDEKIVRLPRNLLLNAKADISKLV